MFSGSMSPQLRSTMRTCGLSMGRSKKRGRPSYVRVAEVPGEMVGLWTSPCEEGVEERRHVLGGRRSSS